MPTLLPALLLLSAAPVQLRALPEAPATATAAQGGVAVFLLNEGDADAAGVAPARIVTVTADGVEIILVPAEAAPATIPAHGFARVRYVPAVMVARASSQPSTTPAPPPRKEASFVDGSGIAAAFVDRFAPHEPTYGVFGLGDSAAKLQVSFAFRPFDADAGVLRHLRFAYTQTMFWAIDRPSGPFRATTYTPEVYADVALDPATRVAFGYRHDSNGRGDPGSLDANRAFIGVSREFALGDGWRASLASRAWLYFGAREAGRDLDDYLGDGSLTATLYRANGLKLSSTIRGSIGSGRGAGELFASYPLTRLGGGLGIYLFGQAFTGYGEVLEDYRVRDSHARIGIALTR